MLLNTKLGGFKASDILIPFIKISYATLFMGLSIYTPLKILDLTVFDTSKTLSLLILTSLVTTIGFAFYFAFTYAFKVEEIELLYKVVGKLNLKDKQKISPAQVVSETGKL